MANFNLNKVILAGRLTSDVELKQTPSGVAVATFSLAVNRKFSKEGEQQADFISCTAWRTTAEFISRYFRKGSALCVVGSIQTRTWSDQNGNKRYATEVVVDEAMFVESRNDGIGNNTPDAYNVSQDESLPF
jgi:single-strand DNA-binding protein